MILMIALVFVVCVSGGTVYRAAFGVTNVQEQIVQQNEISYDIYKGKEKIATVYNYEKLTAFLETKFKEKIAVGDGKLYFANTISVVESYTNEKKEDTIETYTKIAEQADFEVSAIQVKNLDTGVLYYVPNMNVWYAGIAEIQEVLASTDSTTNLVTLGSNIEYQYVQKNVEDVLSQQDVTNEMMKVNQLYNVTSQDTLETVASTHAVTVPELLAVNPTYSDNMILVEGTTLNIPNTEYRNQFTQIKIIDRQEPVLYNVEYIDDDTAYTSEEEVIQEGVDGQQILQLSVKHTPDGEEMILNQKTIRVLSEPVTKIIRRGTKEAPDRGTGKFIWPATSRRVSTEFGDDYLYGVYRFHAGIDINEGLNANIFAADNGVVVTSTYESGYGNYVIIDHNNGYWTLYAHLNSANVRVGQIVVQGDVIGAMGSTGQSTGPHLHFEVRVGANTKEKAQNPRNFVS